MPSIDKLSAIRTLGLMTRGFFDIYELSGPSNAAARQNLMTQLTGEKLPQAKCGVNALMDAFYSACDVQGSCGAARSKAFEAYCREFLVKNEAPTPVGRL